MDVLTKKNEINQNLNFYAEIKNNNLDFVMHPENKEALFNWLDKPVKNKNTHEKADRLVNLIKCVYTNKNYLVKTPPKTHDRGIDLEVYDKNGKIYGLFQAKNLNKRLSDDDVSAIIQKIANNYKNKGNSKNIPILIVSTQGFTNDGKNFKCNDLPNIKLLNFEDFHAYLSSIAGLKAEILNTLKHYQIDDYVKSITILKNYKKLYLNLPPSYGKSFIIKTIIQNQFHAKKILWLTPSKEIMKNILKNTKLPETDNITSLTYTKLVADIKKGIIPGANLIVLDELHRTGAFTFKPAVETLIKNNPNASIIAASASDERSDGKQMVKELFSEIDKEKITISRDLAYCFKEDIIQIPNYLLRGYNVDLTEELNELEKNVPESKKDDFNKVKKKLIADWDKRNNLDDIVAEDFKQTHECKKGLIFCESIEKLNQQKDGLSRAFRKINKKPPKIYTYVSEIEDTGLTSQEMKQQFEDYQATHAKNYHLLFTVNKLNEGLHLNDLDFVVFLRKTQSNILFLQQLGRILKPVNDSQKGIWVYDYAANLNRTNVIYFKKIHAYKAKQNEIRKHYGFEEVSTPVCFEDPIFVEKKKLIEKFKFKFSTWMENFDAIKEFCKIKNRFPYKNELFKDLDLNQWMVQQRSRLRFGHLDVKQKGLLEGINLEWSPNQSKFYKFLSEYIEYLFDNHEEPKQGSSLGNWVNSQRYDYKKNNLAKWKIELLENIGFDWEPEKTIFFKMISLLIEYTKKYEKHPMRGERYKNEELGSYFYRIRRNYTQKQLAEWKINELNKINFPWNLAEFKFKRNESILDEFIKEKNRWPLRGKDTNYKGINIGQYVNTHAKRLLNKKIELGFHIVDTWSNKFKNLKDFIDQKNYWPKQSDKDLYAWVKQQRRNKKKGILQIYQIKLLESLGMVWEPSLGWERIWLEKYKVLIDFKDTYKRFPKNDEEHLGVKIGSWCYEQRVHRETLTEERKSLLKKIKFPFIIDMDVRRNVKWNQMYDLLKELTGEFNEFILIPHSKFTIKLKNWVKRQKALKKQNKLLKERIQKLNEINFPWELRKVKNNQVK